MTPPQEIVYVVEPDAAVRAGLEPTIRRMGAAVETFGTAAAFLARPPRTAPGCVVLELDLPDRDGFDVLRHVGAELPVVVATARADIPTSVRAVREGALEFLPKPAADDALLAAVGQALARSRAVLAEQTELLALRSRYESLSVREREVMAHVVAGLLNKQVGAALGISEVTVKAHRGSVMRKMGADSLAGLVRAAIRLRLPAAPHYATWRARIGGAGRPVAMAD